MDYLKRFLNHSGYTEYLESGNMIKPNVSYCEDASDVHYNPIDPYGGHDYVEIGGLKWATVNLGATSATDSGLYFQWGDTQGYTASQVGSGSGQKYFGWEDYKYGDGTSEPPSSAMTKYNNTDGLTILLPEDDAATAAWGGNWRIPTKEEFQTLSTSTTTAWTSDYNGSGVAGLILTPIADSNEVLFFPAGGLCDRGGVTNVGVYGNYSSSTLKSTNVGNSTTMYFNSTRVWWTPSGARYYGNSIRPVAD